MVSLQQYVKCRSFISWEELEGMPMMWPWACCSRNANVVVEPKMCLWRKKICVCVKKTFLEEKQSSYTLCKYSVSRCIILVLDHYRFWYVNTVLFSVISLRFVFFQSWFSWKRKGALLNIILKCPEKTIHWVVFNFFLFFVMVTSILALFIVMYTLWTRQFSVVVWVDLLINKYINREINLLPTELKPFNISSVLTKEIWNAFYI